MRFLSLIRGFVILALIGVSVSAWADPLVSDEPQKGENTYTWVPSVGYHLGFSELAGQSTTSHGPYGNLRLYIQNDGVFFFADGSANLLLGLPDTVFGLAGGMGIGGASSEGRGFWAGIDYHLLTGYQGQSIGAPRFRLGMFFPSAENRIDIEAHYVTYDVETTTKIYHYTYFGLQVGFSFP